MAVQFSTWNSTVATFVGNSANYYGGGAVYALNSDCNFGTLVYNTGPQNIGSQLFCHSYQNTFRNNSADQRVALHVYRSTIELIGSTTFEENGFNASLLAWHSKIFFKRPTTFINN